MRARRGCDGCAPDDVSSHCPVHVTGRTVPVPKHLKDSHYSAAKKQGFGTDYKYPHNYEGGFVPQDYLGVKLDRKYYEPKDLGCEKNIKRYLQKLQSLIKESKHSGHIAQQNRGDDGT